MDLLVRAGVVMRGTDLFERACSGAIRVYPPNLARAQGRRRGMLERLQSLDREIHALERGIEFDSHDDRTREAMTRRLVRLRLLRDRGRRILEQPAFHRALEYTNLKVTLDGVLRLALLVALGAGLVSFIVFIVVLAGSGPGHLVVGLGLLVVVAPTVAYGLIVSYPEGLARRLRVASLGSAPEAVNYMAMSMRVVPSLDRAVQFAAQHAEEPLASRLRTVLWDVYLRSPPGIEASFLRFAAEWGEWQEDVKRALFALGSASLERTEAGLDRTLEKARQIAFEGTKARITEYAAALRGPTTVLFALGVMLPLIIGAMLPLISLGGLTPSVVGAPRPPRGVDLTVPAVLAMDLVFPVGAFAYAYRILGGRPGTGGTSGMDQQPARRVFLAAVVLGGAAVVVLALATSSLTVFIALWLAIVASLVYLVPGLRETAGKRKRIKELEVEFPDALFILGSRIAEGVPVERAFQLTAQATRNSEVSTLLGQILRALETSREGLEDVLFSKQGILQDVPSRTIRAAMRMVVEVSKKDPVTAGKTIVETASYLRDLRHVDRGIHRDLSSVVDAMESTGAFFAPMVLGVTCALYGLLSRAFSPLVVLALSPASFLAIVGVYLIMVVAVITYFRVGITHGRDSNEMRGRLARTWPVSMAVFTAAFAVAEIALGV